MTLTFDRDLSGVHDQSQVVDGRLEVDNAIISPLIRCLLNNSDVDCGRNTGIFDTIARTSFVVNIPFSANASFVVTVQAYLPPDDMLEEIEATITFGMYNY